MNVTPDVTDHNMIAWDLFTRTLDVELLELERCVNSAPSADIAGRLLHKERFGSRAHNNMIAGHEIRRTHHLTNTAAAQSFSPRGTNNPHNVRAGQWWLRTNANAAKSPPQRVICVAGAHATLYGAKKMMSVPLEKFNGRAGGYELVVVNDHSVSAVVRDRHLEIALAALDAVDALEKVAA